MTTQKQQTTLFQGRITFHTLFLNYIRILGDSYRNCSWGKEFNRDTECLHAALATWNEKEHCYNQHTCNRPLTPASGTNTYTDTGTSLLTTVFKKMLTPWFRGKTVQRYIGTAAKFFSAGWISCLPNAHFWENTWTHTWKIYTYDFTLVFLTTMHEHTHSLEQQRRSKIKFEWKD